MPYKIVIAFDAGPEGTQVWQERTHRIQNFSEDLYRTFRDGQVAAHQVVDQAATALVVAVRSQAKVRTVHAKIQVMLEKQFSDGIACIQTVHNANKT